MIEKILNKLFNRKEIVNCEKDIYLTRWFIIRTKYFALFLHKFHRSDEDRALHDHPWPFIVIPIWRGYIEHSDYPCECFCCEEHPTAKPHRIGKKRRVWPILGTRFRPATFRHRVELLRGPSQWGRPNGRELPAWSLFIRFRKVREWGFWMPVAGFVQWNKWWQENCE